MKKFAEIRSGVLLVVWVLLQACSGKESSKPEPVDEGKDRQAILSNLSDQIIIPGYAAFKVKLDNMVVKSDAFAAAPNVKNLQEFRKAWQEAYVDWQKVELFDVGPAAKRAIISYYNIYPTNVTGIEANIDNPAANLEITASFDRQGFPALDYLINGVGVNDAAIVQYYTSSANGAKRLAYVKRITEHMQVLLGNVIADWNGPYYTEFTTKTGTDIGSPMGELVNGYVLHYERYLRSGKFGIPSGAMLNGIVAAEKVEAVFKRDLSLQLATTAHEAAVDFFNGKSVKSGMTGPSFKSYLDALGAKDVSTGKMLSEVINGQFAMGQSRIDALQPDFYQQVTGANQEMKNVYNELQKAVRMLKVDMTSAMSITITYTDNDGD